MKRSYLLRKDRRDVQTASTGQLLKCLPQIFHRQTSFAVQSKTALEQELEQANKKAMRYFYDLHSAE